MLHPSTLSIICGDNDVTGYCIPVCASPITCLLAKQAGEPVITGQLRCSDVPGINGTCPALAAQLLLENLLCGMPAGEKDGFARLNVCSVLRFWERYCCCRTKSCLKCIFNLRATGHRSKCQKFRCRLQNQRLSHTQVHSHAFHVFCVWLILSWLTITRFSA